jgi:hypothetical protein
VLRDKFVDRAFLLAAVMSHRVDVADTAPPLRIGVRSDMSSLSTDNGGQGSVVAVADGESFT